MHYVYITWIVQLINVELILNTFYTAVWVIMYHYELIYIFQSKYDK